MKERVCRLSRLFLALLMMFSVVYAYMPEVYGETITINKDTFPDDNFREYIIENYGEELDSYSLASVSSLHLDNKSIADLTGVEYFSELTYLSLDNNLLDNLDVSQNSKLIALYCNDNNLNNLDVSANTSLMYLDCGNNDIESLDLSYNNMMYELSFPYCNVSSIDLSNNTELVSLDCDHNNLIELDLSNNTKLELLNCSYNTISTLKLSSSVNYIVCANNELTSLDLTNNEDLYYLDCVGNKLVAVNVAENASVTVNLSESQEITIDNLSLASYDLTSYDASIDSANITNLEGATLTGTILTDFTNGGTVSYDYIIASGNNYISVILYLSGYPDLSITTQPSDVRVEEGEDATFEVEAQGGSMSTTSYQWYYATSSSGSGIEISDATSTSYTLTPDTSYDGYYYYCVVTNGSESVTSDRALLTVNEAEVPITGVSLNKSSLTLEIEETFTLTATISPSDTTDDTTLTWTSSDTSVATVSSSGKVIAKAAGSAVITVTTSNGYNATCQVTVNKRNISDCTISISGSFTYNKSAQEATVTVKYDSTTLTKDTDYTLSYKNNTNAGTATVTITGIGNYTSSVNKTYTISKKDISGLTYSSISSQTYTGKAIKPSITIKYDGTKLIKDTDYTLSYKNNTNAGTATITIKGKGNYTGTVTKNFTISKKSISGLTYSSPSSKTYTGKAIKPSVTVKYNGTKLKSGTDYTVSYSNNTKVGTAKMKFTGKGNYKGTKTLSFKIKARSVSGLSYSSVSKKTYTGKAIKPSVTVKYNGTKLKKNTDYKVSYSNNKNTGKATIKITGKGNYTGTKKIYFYIVPKKVSVSSTSSTKDSLTVKWKKATGSSGYQVAYSTSKNKNYKTVNVGSSSLSRKITGLSSNKTYYVKVRAYKTVSGKKHYGSYSSIQTVKTKKASNKAMGEKIANLALTKLGCQYVKGASGPKTFDSAGFIVYCHKEAGVKTKIKKNVVDIAKLGTSVSKSDIQPGDTVIFKNNTAGIYVGNNQVIVASSRPKAKVQRTSLDGYSKIRRLY